MLLISTFCRVEDIILSDGSKHEISVSIPANDGGMMLSGSLWSNSDTIERPVHHECFQLEAEYDPPQKGDIGVFRNVLCFYRPIDAKGAAVSLDISGAPSARFSVAGTIVSKDDSGVAVSWSCYNPVEGAHNKSATFSVSGHLSNRLKAIERGRHIHLSGLIVDPHGNIMMNYQITSTSVPTTSNKRKDYFQQRKQKATEVAEAAAANPVASTPEQILDLSNDTGKISLVLIRAGLKP